MTSHSIHQNSRFVAVFNDNTDVVISEESVLSPQLAIGFEDIDLNFDSNILCLSLAEWEQLGPLPSNHTLMDILEHPVLHVLYANELYSEHAEEWLLTEFPDEFPYFELSSDTPDEIIEQLRLLAQQLESMTLSELQIGDDDE